MTILTIIVYPCSRCSHYKGFQVSTSSKTAAFAATNPDAEVLDGRIGRDGPSPSEAHPAELVLKIDPSHDPHILTVCTRHGFQFSTSESTPSLEQPWDINLRFQPWWRLALATPSGTPSRRRMDPNLQHLSTCPVSCLWLMILF